MKILISMQMFRLPDTQDIGSGDFGTNPSAEKYSWSEMLTKLSFLYLLKQFISGITRALLHGSQITPPGLPTTELFSDHVLSRSLKEIYKSKQDQLCAFC